MYIVTEEQEYLAAVSSILTTIERKKKECNYMKVRACSQKHIIEMGTVGSENTIVLC